MHDEQSPNLRCSHIKDTRPFSPKRPPTITRDAQKTIEKTTHIYIYIYIYVLEAGPGPQSEAQTGYNISIGAKQAPQVPRTPKRSNKLLRRMNYQGVSNEVVTHIKRAQYVFRLCKLFHTCCLFSNTII